MALDGKMHTVTTVRVALRTITGAALLFFLLQLPAAPPAFATPSFEGSGTISAGVHVLTGIRMTDDGNLIIEVTGTHEITGTLSGTFVEQEVYTVQPTGETHVRTQALFNGTVAGKTGTAVIEFRGVLAGAVAVGSFVVRNGTGGLVGLHAEGTAEITVGVGGTYSGQFHFD